MTNINCIRRMSLPELAQFLCAQGWCLGEEGECRKWLEDEATELASQSSTIKFPENKKGACT